MHTVLLAAAIIAAQVRLGTGPESGAHSPSLAELERQVRTDSNDAIVHYELGMAYWGKKQWDKAEAAFRTAIRVAPSYADPHLALAMVAVRRGERYWKERRQREGEARVAEILREHAGYYRRAFLLNPLVDLRVFAKFETERSGLFITKDGRLLLVAGPWWGDDLIRAANEFREARYEIAYERLNRLAADPRFTGQDTDLPRDLLWFQGLAAAHVGQFDHAIRNLGILTGRAVAALEDTTRTEGWLPFVANDYRYIMATLMYLGNRHDQAIPTFQRTLEFDLGLYVAHVQLARMYEAQGRMEEALKERRLALDVNQDDADLLVDLAMTLVKMNRLTDALEPLSQAAARNPRDARVPYLQGKVARALAQPADARAAFKRFVAMAPSRFANLKSEALQALAELP